MKKELIELQRGCFATAVVILDEYYKNLGPTVFMEASMRDVHLFACQNKNPLFKEKLEKVSSGGDLTYFVLRNLDKLSCEEQNRYVGLVKDREFCGYFIPKNVILVFTIQSEENIKKIAKELYQFCVVAI